MLQELTFFALFRPDPLHVQNKVYTFVLSNAKDNRKKKKSTKKKYIFLRNL